MEAFDNLKIKGGCKIEKLPNKACTRRVGFCAIYKHFSGFGLSLLPSIIHARPHAGNANRWQEPALNLSGVFQN
jgi:hypothetical protein